MNDSRADSPLHAVSAGEQATEAFALLGNKTRLAILVALWNEGDPVEGKAHLRFSELYDRVGATDSGQFNYHLDRLDGHFVTTVDGGYKLTEAGLKFVRSVIAGTGLESPELEPTTIDMACTLCGEDVEIMYDSGRVYIRCSECDGLWSDHENSESGHLAKFSLDPAGLQNRSPEEIYAAAWVNAFRTIYSMLEGVCPICTGHVERSLEVCDDHGADGTCRTCGNRAKTIARLQCTVCKNSTQATIGVIAKYHPRVVSFCYDHGLALQYGFNTLAHIGERLTRIGTEIEHVSTDPVRIRVTTELDCEDVWIELNENLDVVDDAA